MNLYKIEYNFNEVLYKNDRSEGTVPEEFMDIEGVFAKLNTHVLASSFFDATRKMTLVFKENKYLSVAKISPTDVNINILE